MTRTRGLRLVRAAALCVVLWAPQAHAQGGGAPATDDDARAMVAELEALAEVVGASASDCDAMAVALATYEALHGEALRTRAGRLAALDETAADALHARYAKRLEDATTKMLPGLQACAGHKRVVQLMKGLSTLPAEPEAQRPEAQAVCDRWLLLVRQHPGDCLAISDGLRGLLSPENAVLLLADPDEGLPSTCRDALAETLPCAKDEGIQEALQRIVP